ncbi:MAG: glycosyltransferase family 4 protein [Parcubacteria group bacterium]|jgi:phosphatidylinositol alpha-1,6-mannosyltransferase
MRILFISRAFPPIHGGIENQNYGISKALSEITEVKIIANKKGKKFLPVFLPWVAIRSIFAIRKYDVVLFGDGVLSPMGVFLKIFYPKKKYISIIHGLDITFARNKSLLGKAYRLINIPSHKRMDKLIMVGNETIREAVKIGIPEEKCVFIPNGIDPSDICEEHTRSELEKLTGLDLSGKKVIVRIGRYVKHKGIEWFIRKVMPGFPENYVLVAAGGVVAKKTAGDKNFFPACQRAVEENNLGGRVKLLTNLPWRDMKILFNTADLFVSPNIIVPGSMEGFGINAVEGAACGRVVVASRLEGLKDAIKDGENGFLVDPGNSEAYIEKIKDLLSRDEFRKEFGKKAEKYTIQKYRWDVIARKYVDIIEKVAEN